MFLIMCYLSKKDFHILIVLTLLKANKYWKADTEQYYSKPPLTTQVFSAQYFLKCDPEYDSMTEPLSFILAISICNICHFIFWTAVCKITVGYFLVKYPFFKNVFISWDGMGGGGGGGQQLPCWRGTTSFYKRSPGYFLLHKFSHTLPSIWNFKCCHKKNCSCYVSSL